MRYALDNVLKWTPSEVEDQFSRRHPPVSRDRNWHKQALPLTSEDAVDNFHLMCGKYAALLYISKLETERVRWKQKGAQFILEHLYEWMRDELGSLLSYEFAIAVDLLGCKGKRHSEARSLLHYGGDKNPDKLANNAWNAAWDVWFLRLPEGYRYGLLPSVKPAIAQLVTANTDPAYIRTISELRLMFDAGDSQVSYHHSNWNPDDFVAPIDIEKIIKMDPIEAHARSRRDPEMLLQKIIDTLDSLEASLGVEHRTLTDVRLSMSRPRNT